MTADPMTACAEDLACIHDRPRSFDPDGGRVANIGPQARPYTESRGRLGEYS